MKITINNTELELYQEPTDIFGLKFKPQLDENVVSNDADWGNFGQRQCTYEVSPKSYQFIRDITQKYMTDAIMEIGISRNGDGSFTHAMLSVKPDHIPYIGVDLDDKSYLDNIFKNVYTIKSNSFDQTNVRTSMKNLGVEKLSILFIDGWHSVNAVINDWLYSDLLTENGIVIFHDTNYHPGPVAILPAIDEKLFRVEKYFVEEDDYGVAIAYRI